MLHQASNLSNLFSLQTVTPIHVAPAMWLGLHWKGLRGEAVLAGMLVGLSVTFGFTFSALNVKLALGLEETKQGWSPALIGFCFNPVGIESHRCGDNVGTCAELRERFSLFRRELRSWSPAEGFIVELPSRVGQCVVAQAGGERR